MITIYIIIQITKIESINIGVKYFEITGLSKYLTKYEWYAMNYIIEKMCMLFVKEPELRVLLHAKSVVSLQQKIANHYRNPLARKDLDKVTLHDFTKQIQSGNLFFSYYINMISPNLPQMSCSVIYWQMMAEERMVQLHYISVTKLSF